MNRTIGIFAHVDAGKTTLSEQILYRTGAIRTAGCIEKKNTTLDYENIERQRGITVFSAQSRFSYNGNDFYLIDTPGHTDFAPETERVLAATDAAILLVSAADGVQAHTKTLFRLTQSYNVPVFFFINKTDRPQTSAEKTLKGIQKTLFTETHFFKNAEEAIAATDENLFDAYMQNKLTAQQWIPEAKKAVRRQQICFACAGSARTGEGVDELLQMLDTLTPVSGNKDEPLSFYVYKTLRDEKNVRLSHLKIISGTIRVKDSIGLDKINELRVYNGAKYTSVAEATAGMTVTAAGLSQLNTYDAYPVPRQHAPILTPALKVKCTIEGMDTIEAYPYFERLTQEEPALHAQIDKTGQITLRIMGKIQLEILSRIMQERFGLCPNFGKPDILYLETPAKAAIGIGHYEPLRHYAEVILKVEPAPIGSGILFESKVSEDALSKNFQRLIQTHVFEKQHLGTTLGAPLTDAKITLLAGRAHEKHTEGGDFRQSVYRAIRQALRKSGTVVLEPLYRFEIDIPQQFSGRILADLTRMSAEFNEPYTENEQTKITGQVAVSQAANYPQQLAAICGGQASCNMQVFGHRACKTPQTEYDPDKDEQNPCGSVFCAKGAGFYVPWDEVDKFSHCISELKSSNLE